MGTSSIFYWVSVVMAIYAAYLIFFCTRKVEYNGKRTDEGFSFPRIFYLLAVIIVFVPIVNFLIGIGVIIVAIMANSIEEDFYFKSWLFDKPEKKGKE